MNGTNTEQQFGEFLLRLIEQAADNRRGKDTATAGGAEPATMGKTQEKGEIGNLADRVAYAGKVAHEALSALEARLDEVLEHVPVDDKETTKGAGLALASRLGMDLHGTASGIENLIARIHHLIGRVKL